MKYVKLYILFIEKKKLLKKYNEYNIYKYNKYNEFNKVIKRNRYYIYEFWKQ